MEIIIFGSFFVLSLIALAFNHLAKRTEQQRQSVSNLNFIKFQRSFFFVFFLALLGDWLQGPYVYKLYNYYGYQEHQIATLYVAGFASRYKQYFFCLKYVSILLAIKCSTYLLRTYLIQKHVSMYLSQLLSKNFNSSLHYHL